MSADTTFRTKSEPEVEPVSEVAKETRSGDEGEREVVPYLNYEGEHGHPYSVDYFELGDTWDDPSGGFRQELAVMEEYMEKQIESGEAANSIDAIKARYKEIEKITKVSKEERAVVKVETISAYIKFLMETDKTKFNLMRYGKYGNN